MPGAFDVVDDSRAGMTGQHLLGQRHQHAIRPDDLAGVGHHAQPVGVAIEGQTDIGPVFAHRRLQVGQILRDAGIGVMVRKPPVHFAV